jgi:hypothetical protein
MVWRKNSNWRGNALIMFYERAILEIIAVNLSLGFPADLPLSANTL